MTATPATEPTAPTSASTASTAGPPRVRVRRSSRASWVGAVIVVPLLVVAFMAPYLVDRGLEQRLVLLFTFIIMGTAWNLMAGYAGMVSIGQQAFVGLGAYGLVYFADILGLPPLLAIFVGVVVAGLISLPVSLLTFRLTGGYFAIGTWVVAEVMRQLISQWDEVGAGGGHTISSFASFGVGVRIAYVYWLGLLGVVGMVAITYILMRSRLGLGFTAIRDESVAAASLGVGVTTSKRVVYVVAAMGAALAGSLTAANALRVQPNSAFSISSTVAMIFIVVIGGIGTIEGPIVGAVVYWVLQDQLSSLGSWYLVILGVVVIVITLYAPRGLWGLVSRGGRLKLFPVGYRLVVPEAARTRSAPATRPEETAEGTSPA